MEGSEYPKAIYRDGGAELVWGQPIMTSAANSPEEEKAAIAGGWRLSPVADPLDHDGDGRKGGSRRAAKQKDS